MLDEVVIASIDVAELPEERETLVGLRDILRPDGDSEAESDTNPAKLLRLVSVMVEVDDEPTVTDKLLGLAEMVKSGWLTLTVWETETVALAES